MKCRAKYNMFDYRKITRKVIFNYILTQTESDSLIDYKKMSCSDNLM